MQLRLACAVVVCLAGSGPVSGQGQGAQGAGAAAQAPLQETVAPDIPGVVAGGTPVRIVKTGFAATEGPIAMADGSLLLTEAAANRINRIDRNDSVTVFMENTAGTNALAFDARGRLISVDRSPGRMRIAVIHPKGSEAVLADSYDGRPFGGPNDLVVDRRGGVYFTEPGAGGGGGRGAQPPAGPPPLPPTVYYVPPGGKAVKVTEGFRPNGIQLSPDEKTLYINNTVGEYLLALDVRPDGTAANQREFARYEGVRKTETGIASGADGRAVDSEGRVYIAVPVGVQVVSPAGVTLGVIPLPGSPQNLAFAGQDKRTLYVVGRGNVYKIQMLAQGYRGRAK